MVCGTPELITEINNLEYFAFSNYIIYYCLILFMFFLNIFSDKRPEKTFYEKSNNPNPVLQSNFLSKILYFWVDPLILKGYKNPLTVNDIYDLSPENSSTEIVSHFEYYNLRENKNRWVDISELILSGHFLIKIFFFRNNSIIIALFKAFGPKFYLAGLIRLFYSLMLLTSPQILRYKTTIFKIRFQ